VCSVTDAKIAVNQPVNFRVGPTLVHATCIRARRRMVMTDGQFRGAKAVLAHQEENNKIRDAKRKSSATKAP
jgi:hypothetical protein